jgi:hypothetical protein
MAQQGSVAQPGKAIWETSDHDVPPEKINDAI